MPKAWTAKDERQYKEVKQSALEQGRSENRAEEIAARVVNQQRRREGRTATASSRSKRNDNSSLEERSKDELYDMAKQRNISGRSNMSKRELVSALRRS